MFGVGIPEIIIVGVALLALLVIVGAVLGVYWLLTRNRK